MKKYLSVAAVMLALAGCRREDVREFTVSIPGLSETNQALVVSALDKYEDAIDRDSFRWDFEKKTLTLRYDSMKVAKTNIRMAIGKKGVKVEFPEPK
jgi:hypothetical protein